MSSIAASRENHMAGGGISLSSFMDTQTDQDACWFTSQSCSMLDMKTWKWVANGIAAAGHVKPIAFSEDWSIWKFVSGFNFSATNKPKLHEPEPKMAIETWDTNWQHLTVRREPHENIFICSRKILLTTSTLKIHKNKFSEKKSPALCESKRYLFAKAVFSSADCY